MNKIAIENTIKPKKTVLISEFYIYERELNKFKNWEIYKERVNFIPSS